MFEDGTVQYENQSTNYGMAGMLHLVGLFCNSRSLLPQKEHQLRYGWYATFIRSLFALVGLFCLYTRSLLTLET